jgi:hypothetical protein
MTHAPIGSGEFLEDILIVNGLGEATFSGSSFPGEGNEPGLILLSTLLAVQRRLAGE